jgi:hypothetical protein
MTMRNRAGSTFRIYITFWYFTYVCIYIYIHSRHCRQGSGNLTKVCMCIYVLIYKSVDFIVSGKCGRAL